jgi:hypothetical protein
MSQIFPPDRDTKRKLYCGPTAIMAVTGLSASKVLWTIERGRGEDAYNSRGHLKGVVGMRVEEIRDVLYELGYRPSVILEDDPEPTFARWLEHRAKHPLTVPVIVRIRRHFLAVSGDGKWVCDTKTKTPVLAYRAPNRRARVTHNILVFGGPK